ncbi:MAG: hypothetical protein U9R00_00965 [Patescibacteria group bacterium]|nr:hypothetical protein [Patescibacteria group bacterium]
MNSETKNCQNCKKDFTIETNDFNFYKKIDVPAPTFCPECREQRRMAHRNIDFFLRKCDLCNENSISIWHPNIKGYKFYCNECWNSDKWNSLDYGMEFDFNKSFFEQYEELYKKVPKHISNSFFQLRSDYVINAH